MRLENLPPELIEQIISRLPRHSDLSSWRLLNQSCEAAFRRYQAHLEQILGNSRLSEKQLSCIRSKAHPSLVPCRIPERERGYAGTIVLSDKDFLRGLMRLRHKCDIRLMETARTLFKGLMTDDQENNAVQGNHLIQTLLEYIDKDYPFTYLDDFLGGYPETRIDSLWATGLLCASLGPCFDSLEPDVFEKPRKWHRYLGEVWAYR
jgi:hypothetical protein